MCSTHSSITLTTRHEDMALVSCGAPAGLFVTAEPAKVNFAVHIQILRLTKDLVIDAQHISRHVVQCEDQPFIGRG